MNCDEQLRVSFCLLAVCVFYYSTHTVSNQKPEVGNAGNEAMTVM